MNLRASPVTSSTSTPTTVPPWELSLRCQRSSTGASPRHGPHHEAQKFSTTTLPLYEESGTLPPPSSFGSDSTGAAGRVPAASLVSIDVSSRFEATPYASSATSARTPARATRG